VRARHPCCLFGLDPCIRQIGSRGSLDGDVDLGLILGSEKARTHEPDSRKRERGDERPDRDQNHCHPVVERPGDQALVLDGHPVKPLIEPLQSACDRIAALVRLDLRISPVS